MNVSVSENDAKRISNVLTRLLETYDVEDSDPDYHAFAYVDKVVTFKLEDIRIFENFIKKSYPSSWSWTIDNKNVGKIIF